MTEQEKAIWENHCKNFPEIKTWSEDKQETARKAYLAGYKDGYEDCRHYAHDYYISGIQELKKENERLRNDLFILVNPRNSFIVENGESIIAESQIGNCCIADRNENQKVGLNNEPPEIQKLIDSSAKFLAELIAKDED